MHGAVLQNKKYIEFAEDNTVEVIALQRLDEAMGKEKPDDPRIAQYDGVDESGNPVKFMLQWPGLTLEQIGTLNRSPAGQFNDTGGIPYTAFVDPHTGKKLRGLSGGKSAKQVMETVEAVKAELEAQHGKGIKRSELKKFEAEAAKTREVLKDAGAAKAFAAFSKAEKLAAKAGEAMQKRSADLLEEILKVAETELDAASEKIDSGDLAGAKKDLNSLARPLKGTRLEERVNELQDKTKSE